QTTHRALAFSTAPALAFSNAVHKTDTAPASLLIQLDDDDLTKKAKTRLASIKRQNDLPLNVIRENSSVDPDAQVALAKEIAAAPSRMSRELGWKQFPTWDQLKVACGLIWLHFVGSKRMKGTVASGDQLAFKIDRLRRKLTVRQQVQEELEPGLYAAKNANEAVERVLDFERTWATFEFPRYLMALSRIQNSVLSRLGFPAGDYSVFAAQVECLFRNPVVAALDEYGIPLQVAEKLQRFLGSTDNLDAALDGLRHLDVDRVSLSAFEYDVVSDAKNAL
ncbi:MAG: helicase, partial [Planctomycetota bacterium]|nr:helicase [Planctomycetota bacterium]